jgi:hypothetical protein
MPAYFLADNVPPKGQGTVPNTTFTLRVDGGTTQIKFAAGSQAGNTYLVRIGTSPNLIASIGKNVVDAGGSSVCSGSLSPQNVLAFTVNNANFPSADAGVSTVETVINVTPDTTYAVSWWSFLFNNPPTNYLNFSQLDTRAIALLGGDTYTSLYTSPPSPASFVGSSVSYPGYSTRTTQNLFVFSTGAWRIITQPYVFDGGAWRTMTNEYIKESGAWRTVYRNYDSSPYLTINDGGPDLLDFVVQVIAVN